jgi:multiple sugar transport system ATP-binding protein
LIVPLAPSIYHGDIPVEMGVRPEHVTLGDRGFPGSVRIVQPVGPFTYVSVDCEGGSVTSRVNGVSHLRPKDPVRVELIPEGLHFFDRETGKRLED